jgi:hypothetical protein
MAMPISALCPDESDVHLPQPQKKNSCLLLFFFFPWLILSRFGAFCNKGIPKTRKKGTWAHHKKCGFYFLQFIFCSLGCFARFVFNRVFGRFVITRGVQKEKCDYKKEKTRKFFRSRQKKHQSSN